MDCGVSTCQESYTIAPQVASALRPIRIAPRSEEHLQQQIADCLAASGILFQREVHTETGPVDFVINEQIAVEVKTYSAPIPIARQIIRYLQDERFSQLILVTTRPMRLPIAHAVVGNTTKPIFTIDLWKNFM